MIAKTQEEIDLLRESCHRAARHMRELVAMVKPGLRVAALEERALEMIRQDGDKPAFLGHRERGDKHGYPSALCVSINDAIVHSPAAISDYVIQDGDIVCLDYGVIHKGFVSDHAVTVIAGKAKNPHDEELVRGTKEALAIGIKEAKVGNTTGHIGYAVQKVAEKYGFGYPKNLSGHGVGRSVHEEPYVPNFGEPGRGAKLVENLVIAIEPMMTLGTGDLYVDADGYTYRTQDGSNTAHFEHTVIITKNGPEILTQ